MTIPGWGQKVLLLAVIPVPLDMVDVVTNTGNHSHEEYKCILFHTEKREGVFLDPQIYGFTWCMYMLETTSWN